MNASAEKWRLRADRCVWRSVMGFAILMFAGGLLAGCADVRRATLLPPVNPESPVAGAVAAAATQTPKRPSFASIPPKPLNIPPPAAVKTAVIDMVRCRRAYEVWAAAHPALVSQTDGFAETLRARLDNRPDDRPTPEEEAASEAAAAKLRAYAEPPPPMHPGPPPNPSDAAPPGVKTAAAPKAGQGHTAASAPATPAPGAVASSAPAGSAAPAQTPPVQTVAAVQPSMAPHYTDPLLAHCQ
jgi:hypothetical protein